MKELLTFIVKSIVDSPEQVVVEEEVEEGINKFGSSEISELGSSEIIKFIIKAPEKETGVIIGRQGKTIKAIKSLLSVVAKGKRFSIEVSGI